MTLPANIRVNIGAPFPATVKASAPLFVQKLNGIFTIGLSFNILASQIPPVQKFATDYILIYDSITNSFFKAPLSVFAARPQRLVTVNPVVITTNDEILNLNLPASGIIALPSYLVRGGVPLTFKDVSKQMGTAFFPQTIQAANVANPNEYIDGLQSIPLSEPGQSITLVPANDGVTTGWGQQ